MHTGYTQVLAATPKHKGLLMFLVANESFIWETHLEGLRPTLQVRFAFSKCLSGSGLWLQKTGQEEAGQPAGEPGTCQ